MAGGSLRTEPVCQMLYCQENPLGRTEANRTVNRHRWATPELPSILRVSSPGEVSGTASVEVKFVDIRKNTSGEGGSLARY